MIRKLAIEAVNVLFSSNLRRLLSLAFVLTCVSPASAALLLRTINFDASFFAERPSTAGGPAYNFSFGIFDFSNTEADWPTLTIVPTLNSPLSAPTPVRDSLAALLTTSPNSSLLYEEVITGWLPTGNHDFHGATSVTNNTPVLSGYHIDDITMTFTKFTALNGQGTFGDQAFFDVAMQYDVYGTPIPEPQSCALVILGAVATCGALRRRPLIA